MKSFPCWIVLLSSFVLLGQANATDSVSIFQIIANPTSYNNKNLMVEGVLGFIGEDTVVLYVDHGSWESQITINSFLITTMLGDNKIGSFGRADLKRMDGKYVAVWGKYLYSMPRYEAFTGSIGQITAIGAVPKFPEFSTPAPSDEKK